MIARAVLALALAAPTAAPAQWGGSVVLASDERSRGVSVTGEQPGLRATLGWDHADGAFAGASLAALRYRAGPRRPALQAYGGITRPLAGGGRWEAGAMVQRVAGDARYGYEEAFVGLGGHGWSVRLNVSPDYLGFGAATVYAELDAQRPLAPGWRATGHLGALRRDDGRGGWRWDARLGLTTEAAGLDWQIAWHAVQRGGPFALPARQHHQRWVLSAAWSF